VLPPCRSAALARLLPRPARAVTGTVRWVSPRGTIEVLDDYPYWVAKKFGYFGDIETTLEPGPMEATATVKLVDQEQSDMGYPSPGVFSLALEQGIPLVSAWEMGAYDVFDNRPTEGLEGEEPGRSPGQTVALGSAGWQAICDPMFAQAGVDPKTIKYAEAGSGWGQSLAAGPGGCRAQLGGSARPVDRAGPRLRLPDRPQRLEVPGQHLHHAQEGLRGRLEEGALRDLSARLGHGPRVRPSEPARGHAHRHAAVPEPEALAGDRDGIDDELANVFRGNFEKRQGWAGTTSRPGIRS